MVRAAPDQSKQFISVLERAQLLGALVVYILAVMIDHYCKTHGVMITRYLDTRGVLFGGIFYVLNFHTWKMFAAAIFNSRSTSSAPTLLIGLKSAILIGMFFCLAVANRAAIVSFLLGFTAVMFAGILLAALWSEKCN